ncbi:MAG: MarR family transcriptional regulator [Labilithrix sp.]|nr:MarR family transcriptional regulator [Labilithrix sp.]
MSRALLVTAGNVTGLVDRAERDGVVERRSEPSDRRVVRVWLTRAGRALIRELLPLHASQVWEPSARAPGAGPTRAAPSPRRAARASAGAGARARGRSEGRVARRRPDRTKLKRTTR